MSCIYEKIKCPRCGTEKSIEVRQQQVYCSTGESCAIYFNRLGEIEKFDPIKFSSRPFYDSL